MFMNAWDFLCHGIVMQHSASLVLELLLPGTQVPPDELIAVSYREGSARFPDPHTSP